MKKQNATNRIIHAGNRSSKRALLAIALAGSCALAYATVDESSKLQAEETTLPSPDEIPAPLDGSVALPSVTSSFTGGVPVAIDEVGVSVSVLNTEDLVEEGIYTLGGALQRTPGVYVVPGGGVTPGFSSIPNVRGTCAECYGLTTMDGMKLQSTNTELTGDVVSQTNLFNVGVLEVLRGSQAAIYGGGAVNAVIYMETPEGKGDPSLTLFAEGGSFDTYTASLTAQGVIDKLSYFVNASYAHTDNDFKKTDGTSFDVEDLGKSDMWQESMRLDYRANDDNQTTLTFRRQDSEFRALLVEDGEDGYQDYTKRNTLVTGKHEAKISKLFSTSLFMGYYGTDDTYGDQGVELDNTEMRWENYLSWNEKHKTTLGISWDRSDYYSNKVEECDHDHGDDDDHDHDHEHEEEIHNALENIYGFAINHAYKPTRGWDNNVALRLDSSTQFGEEFTFRFASNYKFNQDKTRVFASLGSGYKAPTQWQLSTSEYTVGSTTYVGNPDLEVETSISADIGIEQQIKEDHKITATYFWTQYKNMLHHHEHSGDDHDHEDSDDHDEEGALMVQNADGHTLSQGVELSLQGVIEKTWNTSYTLSFTYTQPKMNDVQFENSTRQLYSFDLNTQPSEKLTLGVGFSAGAGRVNSSGESIDDYLSARLYARYKMNENLALHFRVENFLDQEYVIDSDSGILNAGPAVYAGFSYTF